MALCPTGSLPPQGPSPTCQETPSLDPRAPPPPVARKEGQAPRQGMRGRGLLARTRVCGGGVVDFLHCAGVSLPL